jgi:hypothetical protein
MVAYELTVQTAHCASNVVKTLTSALVSSGDRVTTTFSPKQKKKKKKKK